MSMSNRKGGGKTRTVAGGGFNLSDTTTTNTVHPKILKQARQSGQLNLSGRGFTTVPDCVWNLNLDLPEEAKTISLDHSEERWWEQKDLTKLILASNSLNSLSEDLAKLSALVVLDVHDNQLTSLPKALGALSELQRLNLSHNKLELLPSELCRLSNLTVLQLQNNCLAELCQQIGDLHCLEELDISNNRISELSAHVGYLSRLRKFNLAHNKLHSLPREIGDLRCLRVLEATHNSLESLPLELGNLCRLEELYLRHNRLSAVPNLSACSSLKVLHLGNNCVEEVTAGSLRDLPSVSILELRDNKISILPEEISCLEGLERLDLSNNNLSGLPYCLGNLSHLKSVVLDGNPMKSIRRDIIMRGTNELKKYLRSRIEDPPTTSSQKVVEEGKAPSGLIGDQGGLDTHTIYQFKALDYSNKQVSTVPDDVWEVAAKAQLQSINLSKNALTELPSNLMVVVDTLKELYLGFNRLTSVHQDIGLYLKLTTLDLRNNKLESLPSEMSSLQNLREIILSNNRLPEIPEVLYNLEKLEILFASDNKIQSIDVSGFLRLKSLGTLDLQNNDIGQVPPELGNCTWIKSLLLGGNAFRNPRPAVLDKGTPALMEYLRNRIVT
ncbi:leucine-rich repeat-containing protein 40-like [Liolophura sinensis]|uniref:leucine-rich repeat-containing protein 40-like n=1 Tax=Liolophura sinensis TaxID=3198878 RepID=UPI003158BFFE